MKRVVISSKNPIKMRSTLLGFQKMFPNETFEIESMEVSSGVSDQPRTSAETYQGAWNRVEAAAKIQSQADFWVGIEGGTDDSGTEMSGFAWAVIRGKKNGKIGKSQTATFILPEKVAKLIREGKELGEADDIVFSRTNSKQKNGAVGLLTGDVVDLAQRYTQVVVLALIPFKNPELYP